MVVRISVGNDTVCAAAEKPVNRLTKFGMGD